MIEKNLEMNIIEARYNNAYEKETHFTIIAYQDDLMQPLFVYLEEGGKYIEEYVNTKVRKALAITGPQWIEENIKFKIIPSFMQCFRDNEWIDLVEVNKE